MKKVIAADDVTRRRRLLLDLGALALGAGRALMVLFVLALLAAVFLLDQDANRVAPLASHGQSQGQYVPRQ